MDTQKELKLGIEKETSEIIGAISPGLYLIIRDAEELGVNGNHIIGAIVSFNSSSVEITEQKIYEVPSDVTALYPGLDFEDSILFDLLKPNMIKKETDELILYSIFTNSTQYAGFSYDKQKDNYRWEGDSIQTIMASWNT